MRRILSPLLALALAVGGCSFGFAGGGLDKSIRTVAVPSFLNDTADPTLTLLVTQAIKQGVESHLGLRTATEQQADAVVRGRIVSYDPDQPLAFTGTSTVAGAPATVSTLSRQVLMTVNIEVINQKTGAKLWDGQNISVPGQYTPGREADGKQKALDLLVKKLIDGIQSNW